MCIDMKISNQANKDKKKAKYEMKNFCEQYGLHSVVSSKKQKTSRDPVNEIIPKEVQEAIRFFSTIKKLTQQEAQLPITLHFFAHYKASWIVK
jgi:hypothetical protein